jgi:hypothetical protein
MTALDEFEIESSWVVADTIRSLRGLPNPPDLITSLEDHRLQRVSAGFQNLVVGSLAERLFARTLQPLAADGFEIVDYHEAGENRDYAVRRGDAELPINVKVASTLFRNAKKVVGIEPEDCIPISAYKAIGASERVPDLVYVDLVDFSLRAKVDEFMGALAGSAATLWELLSWYRGKGARRAQDLYVTRLFADHGIALLALGPEQERFRAISAQRVLAIMRANPRRVPGLGVPAAGMGGFNAEVNVHVSLEKETRAWGEVARTVRDEGIARILGDIRRTTTVTAPAPLL